MKKIVIALLGAVAVLMPSPSARADSVCGVGSICTVALEQTNVIELSGIVVALTIDNSGSNTVLSIQLATNPLTNTALGIDQFGWNAPLVQVGQHGRHPVFGPDPAYLSTGSANFGGHQALDAAGAGVMDGFGSFNVQAQDPAGRGGIGSPIVFTLNGLVTNFGQNNRANEFAAHIRFDGGCSGFVGGISAGPAQHSNSGCTPVPEPGTLTLLGTGLLGMAGVVRRRLRR